MFKQRGNRLAPSKESFTSVECCLVLEETCTLENLEPKVHKSQHITLHQRINMYTRGWRNVLLGGIADGWPDKRGGLCTP